MTKSPLTLRRINKLIGQAMRAVQLAKNEHAKGALRWVICWLNRARRHYKKGYNPAYALRQADCSLRIAVTFDGLTLA